MEQALYNSKMLIWFLFIVGYLCIAVFMAFLYKKISSSWKHHNLLWRPFGSKCATYCSGVFIWVVMSFMIGQFVVLYSEITKKFSLSNLHLLLLIPCGGLIFYLLWNLILSMEKPIKIPGAKDPYDQEVELIKFVERHANYMILGITGVFIAVQFWGNITKEFRPQFELFYLFMILSMLFSVCGVLPLVWSPKGNAEHLEWLRNFKTVWYGYSIYLFFAGIIALAIAIL